MGCRSFIYFFRPILIVLFLCLFVCPSFSQKQLVLLKHERVVNRYVPGSVIVYKLKNHTGYLTSLIVDIQEFAIITSFDTIPFSRIDRVSLKGVPDKGFNNLFGSFLMVAGAAYYGFDQANSIIVQGRGYDNDPVVWKPAVILIGSGFLLKQLRKRSLELRYPVKLFATQPGHVFYRADD